MSYVDQMNDLWNAEKGDLGEILRKLIDLRVQALSSAETVPLEFDLEIIIQANFHIGFGNKVEEALEIGQLVNKCLSENYNTSKSTRIAAILCSAILTQMAVDEQDNTRDTNKIVSIFGVDVLASRSEILKIVIKKLVPLLDQDIDRWFLELVSFVFIMIGILEVLGTWGDADKVILEKIQHRFTKSHKEKEKL